MDCTKLTDDQLTDAWRDVNAELERRRLFRAIPGQVAAMTTEYVAGGGTRADLKTAVEKAPEPTTKTDTPPPTSTGSTGTTSGTSGFTSSGGFSVGVSAATAR